MGYLNQFQGPWIDVCINMANISMRLDAGENQSSAILNKESHLVTGGL